MVVAFITVGERSVADLRVVVDGTSWKDYLLIVRLPQGSFLGIFFSYYR